MLLRQIARRLKEQTRDDDNLARVGASYFTLDISGARNAAEIAPIVEHKLAAAFGKPFNLDQHELQVTLRTGIAIYPHDGEDATTLLRNAEAALGQAEKSGERYLFYTASMHAGVVKKLTMENRLRHALEANQLVLHYQPHSIWKVIESPASRR